MRIYTVILFLALLTITGCHSRNQGSMDDMVTYTPLEETAETEDLSPYIERMELVRLSDDPRLLFSDVAKMLIDNEGHFYILDYGGNLVTVNPDGTFFRQFGPRTNT